MIEVAFERRHRILLSRFIGVFSFDDIEALDAAVKKFIHENGPVGALIDWSDIETIALPPWRLVQRGRAPQIVPGQQRVMIAPPEGPIHDMVRAYADQQRDYGNVEPIVVRSLEEAYAVFGIADPVFEPVS
jgi:hypothetical protein